MKIVGISDKGNDIFVVKLDNGVQIKTTVTVVADYALFSGKEMDEKAVDELRAAASAAGAKRRAVRIIGGRAHSKGELLRKLRDKGENEQDAQTAVDWLCGLGYIDEEAYAGAIVRHYSGKGYGRSRIQNELYRRYIPREFWDDALAEMPENDDKIFSLLSARLGGEDPSRAELKRATDALALRGFSWDEISRAIRRYKETLEEND